MSENQNIINENVVEKAEKKVRVKPTPDANFDWSSSHKKFDNYKSEERLQLEAMYEKTMSQIADHEVVEGTVVGKTSREVVVNIGFKSDGVIPVAEFRHNPNLKVGDKIEVYVENQEGVNGQLILSHKKARILKSWDRVNEAYDKQETLRICTENQIPCPATKMDYETLDEYLSRVKFPLACKPRKGSGSAGFKKVFFITHPTSTPKHVLLKHGIRI